MTKEFDPNGAANADDGIYGLPYSFEESKIILIPVPWEATTSYGGGTALAPQAIIDASVQLDLFDLDVDLPYQAGIHLLPIEEKILGWNKTAKSLAQPIKDQAYGDAVTLSKMEVEANLHRVNQLSSQLNQWVFDQTKRVLQAGKIPGLIGGDHSVPFGAIQAVAQHYGQIGILHFDAHSDTRRAYLGFEHSHASILYNVMTKIPEVQTLVQIGIRDFCQEEFDFIHSKTGKIHALFDRHFQNQKLSGTSVESIATEWVSKLPDQVWVTFDIDGLDPRFCPHTGTPVPGGLDYNEAILFIDLLARSGKKIIGFDVVEVAPDLSDAATQPPQASHEWDANVGMRLIYKIAAYALASQGLRRFR